MENKLNEEFLERRERVARQMKVALIASLAVSGIGLLFTIIGFSLDFLFLKTLGLIMVGLGGLSALLFSMFCLQIRYVRHHKHLEETEVELKEHQPQVLRLPPTPAIFPMSAPSALEPVSKTYQLPESRGPIQPVILKEELPKPAVPENVDENTKQRLAVLDELLKENIILLGEYEKMLKNILEP